MDTWQRVVVQGARPAIGDDGGVDVADPVEPVVPAVAVEAPVGLEQTVRKGCAPGGAVKRLRLGRLWIAGHHQRIVTDRLAFRRFAPIVEIGDAGAPGPELGGAMSMLASHARAQSS